MIEVIEFHYNTALKTWVVLVDGIVHQCFKTKEQAEEEQCKLMAIHAKRLEVMK